MRDEVTFFKIMPFNFYLGCSRACHLTSAFKRPELHPALTMPQALTTVATDQLPPQQCRSGMSHGLAPKSHTSWVRSLQSEVCPIILAASTLFAHRQPEFLPTSSAEEHKSLKWWLLEEKQMKLHRSQKLSTPNFQTFLSEPGERVRSNLMGSIASNHCFSNLWLLRITGDFYH